MNQWIFAHTLEASDSVNKKDLKEERRVLEENQNKYANDLFANRESLLLKHKENIAVKGLSQQEQMEIYKEYKQNLDKIEVDYKENMQKAQSRFVKQTVTLCAICRTEMDCDDESKVTELKCRHEFHSDCLRLWFESNANVNTCPYCGSVCTLGTGT